MTSLAVTDPAFTLRVLQKGKILSIVFIHLQSSGAGLVNFSENCKTREACLELINLKVPFWCRRQRASCCCLHILQAADY